MKGVPVAEFLNETGHSRCWTHEQAFEREYTVDENK